MKVTVAAKMTYRSFLKKRSLNSIIEYKLRFVGGFQGFLSIAFLNYHQQIYNNSDFTSAWLNWWLISTKDNSVQIFVNHD